MSATQPSDPNAAPAAAPSFPFRVQERVRWEDVDLVGIARYSAYTRFFDVAEAELWRAAGTGALDVIERFALWLPRKLLEVEFHAPARFDDLLELRAGIAGIGRSSLTLLVEVWSADGATKHATVRVVVVAVDAASMTARPIPDELRAQVAPYVMRAEADGAAA
ncbi:MAG TPA: thioesterase family protein [Gemmatimonadaceae bacterium]|nr:thioesterase family protein [Gemmatimonadaceae bacterium]